LPAARIIARGVLLPTVAGAACVLGFAPFYAWPLPIAALAVLFALWARSGSPLQAAISGYAFGLGFFLAGTSWVFVSLHYYGSMPLLLAALATFLFCAFLALFPAAAGWIVARLAEPGLSRLWIAPAAFVAFEWVRGWIFTGFPWITVGTSQVPSSPLAGYVPIVGAYGASLAVAGAAAAVAAFGASFAWSRERFALLAAIAALFAGGALLKPVEWTSAAGAPIPIALLQGNVPQELKWRDDVRTQTLLDYRRMIFAADAKVVVLPETALPAFLDQLPAEYLESLREHARATGKDILLGTVERNRKADGGDEYFNSVVSVAATANGSYRKRHLVPFGEFIPAGFKWVLAVLKIPLSDFARGAPDPKPLEAGGTRFGVAICYEDVFGEEVIDFLPGAEVLLNVSNLAWFGRSFAPEQHLQASQMRALETGRWMVRATNTGATAAIDERGRIVSRLPGFTRGTLVEAVVPRKGATPYSRWGNIPALILLAALLSWAVIRRRR
jgi:apolipoprotein N-acyltransferase